MIVLKQSNKGTMVQQLQENLTRLGCSPGAIDGIYGAGTAKAVKLLQQKNGFKATGSVDEKFWAWLLEQPDVQPIKGQVPYLSQKDTRWATVMYSSRADHTQTIASSGCGPTSMAMILSALAKPVLPTATCKYAVDHGFRTANSGTSWGFFPSIAAAYKLSCRVTKSLDDVLAALKAGKPVIANMGKGYFTKNGHYIVLTGTDGKKIFVNDPASKTRNNAKTSVFQAEAKKYFIFS